MECEVAPDRKDELEKAEVSQTKKLTVKVVILLVLGVMSPLHGQTS